MSHRSDCYPRNSHQYIYVSIDLAIRYTEILMGFSFILQSIEHLRLFTIERILFSCRIILSLFIILDLFVAWSLFFLLLLSLALLRQFQGPFNGGADRMGLLILSCLCLAHFSPSQRWQEIALAYLAVQLVLSYFISGWVKVVNPDWRSGKALIEVFDYSTYPVSESLRGLKNFPGLLFYFSWAVILLELLFVFSLMSEYLLIVALVFTAIFHFTNACIFGLNRFFWIWIASYPSLIWFQTRIT